MNAVEIEEAVSDLARAPFDPATFPFEFLTAFGVKETTIARLRKGDTNASDVGGVLQRSNIHIAVAAPGDVNGTLRALRESPKTAAAKAKFILAADGDVFEAEDLTSGEVLACSYNDFADHFGFFLPLAGISTVKEIKNNPIDVKATGRLNRLYVELLRENADWGTPERRHDLNQFMARLIFCFFAEDTGIFNGTNLFTSTVERMSSTERGSVEFVITELFRAMDTSPSQRENACLRSWADEFPYVNGGLFAGGKLCPRFSKVARSYLLRAGELNWQEINPDIFGSMIQAVADEGERGSLGMHYTSVPNIMKVLGPLFLDDLRAQLEAAGDNSRKLRNLRKRLASIRVFDPACGSGNFLVIAYIRMREIEHEIVKITGDEPRSVISLSNFYGIEIKDFAVEIARLALLIAEFQCDVRFISQQVARTLVLPLKQTGEIVSGNALREDWLKLCNYYSKEESNRNGRGFPSIEADQLCSVESNTEIYICGNPPYIGDKMQGIEHKSDVEHVLSGHIERWRSLDYVCAFFYKAAQYVKLTNAQAAFVTTKSTNQGQQVSLFWPVVLRDCVLKFAVRPFDWRNLASHNAGVTCVIIGFARSDYNGSRFIIDGDRVKIVSNISPYLIEGPDVVIEKASKPISQRPKMGLGNVLKDDGILTLDDDDYDILRSNGETRHTRKIVGSYEFINGSYRRCLYLKPGKNAKTVHDGIISSKLERVSSYRRESRAEALRSLADKPSLFYFHLKPGKNHTLVVPRVTSENRDYLPVGFLPADVLISDRNYGIVDGPIWVMSLIASRMHWVWIGSVCVRMRSDFSYSNTLGWNTFPIPELSEKNKSDLENSANNILLAREEYFPATIAELYDPSRMPDVLRRAHENNDEIIERVYKGRMFRNDTERLETLLSLYVSTVKKSNTISESSTVKVGRERNNSRGI
ncbi:class I SAM-dependent DNA methyltransferase [Methylobacterium sp. sgz302541]|uniref:class I SAM-dependent DNA methyltransferase n=1 Tax=unclassified Methylobacterium TaxID=2615210 RepID=UPI003D3314FB